MRCSACGTENPQSARYCNGCGARLDVAPAAAEIPQSVDGGRYEVKHLLGEGARKRVYLALDTRLGREVALALVKTEGLDDVGRQRIEREARATARLGDHPHVVTVHDVGDDDGTPFIVSQRMPGGSLAERLADTDGHRLPIADALRVTEDVALALEHAHGLGIVHRDVKPANVWFSVDGAALLGDFGLAVAVDHSRLTGEGMVVGTVAYLAPEQALGREPDPRADLYALGALAYETLCGRPPFLGDDAVAVISQHLNTAPVVPSWHRADVPAALEALVLQLLAKDPAERPTRATDVVVELRRIGAVSMEPAPVPTVTPRGSHDVRGDWGRFVGRLDELAQLQQALDDACAGRGGLVMVVGEPGIGKTRLVEELATHAAVRGAQVCWGHSYEGDVGVPYLPFVEAFRTYTRARSDEDLRSELGSGAPEIATLVSDLRDRFPDLPSSPPLDAEAERLRLFDGVATFVRNASGTHPLVLLLDDLHWADKPSLLLLQYLARNVRRERVLLVGTYRDVELERTHPLADTVAELRREQLYRRVLLRGLPPEEIKALVEAIGGQEIDPTFADALHRETEGNPFFVAEIIRNLAETGAIRREDGQWVADAEILVQELPEGVREAIGRRLSRLSDPCNRMLTVAAAMPGGFALDVVAATLGADEEELLDPLDEALGVQVVRERKERRGTYEFTHALIRQTLYAELSTPRRVRLHRQIGSALEVQPAALHDAHLNELAYHWFQAAPAGEAVKAVEYTTRAAERARAQAAHDEAARYFDMALQALDFDPDAGERERGELFLALGEARRWSGDNEGAVEALMTAADAARRLGAPELLARAALALVTLSRPAHSSGTKLTALLEEAIALDGLDDALRSRLLASLGGHIAFIDAGAPDLVREAIDVARRSRDPGALARALSTSTFVIRREWEEQAYLDLLDEIDRLATEAGDTAERYRNCSNIVTSAETRGRRAQLDQGLATMRQIARELRSPPVDAGVLSMETNLAVVDGRYDDADRLGGEFLTLTRRIGDRAGVDTYGAILFPMLREQGRLATMEEPTRRVVDAAPSVFAWRCGLMLILLETGRLAEAREHVDVMAADDFDVVPDDNLRLFVLAQLAEVTAHLGETARPERLHELLDPRDVAVLVGPAAYWGSAGRYLGLIDTALGRYDEALEHFDVADAMHERMGARPWAARTRYDRACALAARDARGDAAQAIAVLNDVLDNASVIGMARLTEEALALKLRLQGAESSSITASIDAVAASVSIDRPDLRRHASADGWVTIAFSDLEGYSELTERLGDARTQEVLHAHHALVHDAVAQYGGIEVKSQGDGFMLAFGSPVAALRCADEIRQRVAAYDFGPDARSLRERVGIHTGEAIKERDDFFGRTVIVAARVADAARGGEVLVTDEVRAALPSTALVDTNVRFGPAREIALKGLSGTHRVHPF